jgi:hypothetical protein
MTKEKNNENREAAGESAAIDREVLDVIEEQKRKASGRGPKDAEAERKKKNWLPTVCGRLRPRMRGRLPNSCGRPGYARAHPTGRTLGRLSIRLSAGLDGYLVDFPDSSFLLFFWKLLQGRIHNLCYLRSSLLLPRQSDFCFHFESLPKDKQSPHSLASKTKYALRSSP